MRKHTHNKNGKEVGSRGRKGGKKSMGKVTSIRGIKWSRHLQSEELRVWRRDKTRPGKKGKAVANKWLVVIRGELKKLWQWFITKSWNIWLGRRAVRQGVGGGRMQTVTSVYGSLSPSVVFEVMWYKNCSSQNVTIWWSSMENGGGIPNPSSIIAFIWHLWHARASTSSYSFELNKKCGSRVHNCTKNTTWITKK